jgi:hypothetical protein
MITLSIERDLEYPGLIARRIWGMLYPVFIEEFKGKQLLPRDWDSFLIDVKAFEDIIVKSNDKKEISFYWYVNGCLTDVSMYYNGDVGYKITIEVGKQITIEKIKSWGG